MNLSGHLVAWRAARVVLLAQAVAFAAAPAIAADHPLAEKPLPVISVAGEGKVAASPDMATIQVGVVRDADTAREALDANNAAMNRVLAALKGEGIEPRDLQTSGFSINPKYIYPKRAADGSQSEPKIAGYTVSNNLTVRVRDLAKLGGLLDLVVTLGVNTGGDIQFTNAEPAGIVAKAREFAMKDARARAETLAAAAGVKLGPVIEISESHSAPRPVSLTRGEVLAKAAADAVPVEGGENSYTVNVTARFEILQ
jgi:uncharacterized protein YggE